MGDKGFGLENKDLRFWVAVQSRPLPPKSFGVLQIFYTVEVEVPIKTLPQLYEDLPGTQVEVLLNGTANAMRLSERSADSSA